MSTFILLTIIVLIDIAFGNHFSKEPAEPNFWEN